MTAASQRITSGPIDPDLEAVLPRLAMQARRLRQVDSIMRLPERRYSQLAAQTADRADIVADFTSAAEKLGIPGDRPGRTMLILVEEADRLYTASKRRPSLAQVLTSLRGIADLAARDDATAASDLIEARAIAREAKRRADASAAAVVYLEASSAS